MIVTPSVTCGSLVIVQCLELYFYELEIIFNRMWNTYISCSKHTFYIIRMPISYSRCGCSDISSIYHYKFFLFYRTTKVIGQQKPGFCKFKKVISKTDHKKKDFEHICTSQLFSSISLFCLEGVWSYLSSLMLVIVTFWDIHLHNM